jgi:RNA polymerase sigma-70 factor (ECF subfamily)
MDDNHQLGPLLDRCRAGDPDALEALLDRLRPYVRLLVRPRLGTRLGRRVDDSDLIQESLLRIYRGFDQFAGQSVPQFLAWIGPIVNRVVVDCGRHHGAVKRDLRREVADVEWLAHCLALELAPDRAAMRDEAAPRLAAALERLPETHREVLEARFFDQLTFAEVGVRLGKSEGAVRVVCVRAIERLRRELGDQS